MESESNETTKIENTWPFFSGTVQEAVTQAIELKFMLVVSIQDDKGDSLRLDSETWKNEKVAELLSTEVVSLKLIASSEAARYFYSIYPVLILPTIYFIGFNGAPLKVITGFQTPEQVLATFQEAKNLLYNQPTTPSQSSASSSSPSPSSSPSSSSSAAPSTPQPSPKEQTYQRPHLSEEEQKKKLLTKLEEIKRKKAEEENQKEKENEINRRKNGRESSETVKRLQETKVKRELEEKQKEKKDELAAKKKIKEQIEADKRERKKLFEAKEPKETVLQNPPTGMSLYKTPSDAPSKIAFRLLDGSTVSSQFKSTDTLATAKSFIEMNYNYKRFSMNCPYPRHTYTEDEMNSTLRDLQLHPNGTIIILSLDGTTTQPPSSFPSNASTAASGSWSDTIYSYYDGVKSSFSGLFWPTATTNQPVNPPTNTTPERTGYTLGGSNSGVTQRVRGNIHGLNNSDDTDQDKNSYWNGNSTQQQ